jgi:uncharacterized protein YceK
MKNILVTLIITGGIAGCSTVFTDSASTPDGGIYISGQADGQKAMYYCPKGYKKVDCEKVNITKK